MVETFVLLVNSKIRVIRESKGEEKFKEEITTEIVKFVKITKDNDLVLNERKVGLLDGEVSTVFQTGYMNES